MKTLRSALFAALRSAAFLPLALLALPASAAGSGIAQVLVAKPQLQDAFYRHTVLLVRPLGNQHIGVILNRPTKVTLGQLFPEHAPSQKVPDPVYVGGPSNASVVFAIVQSKTSPGGKSLRFAPGLFMAFEGDTVDRIIEKDPAHARFLAGLVVWKPGELQGEIGRGAWYVMDADPSIVLRKHTEGLWEELVQRAELAANAI